MAPDQTRIWFHFKMLDRDLLKMNMDPKPWSQKEIQVPDPESIRSWPPSACSLSWQPPRPGGCPGGRATCSSAPRIPPRQSSGCRIPPPRSSTREKNLSILWSGRLYFLRATEPCLSCWCEKQRTSQCSLEWGSHHPIESLSEGETIVHVTPEKCQP